MKTLLKLEELAQFLACLMILVFSDVPWWAFLALLLGPDIGMLGYLVNSKIGAVSYNILHHKGFALFVAFIGGLAYYSVMSRHNVNGLDSIASFERAMVLFAVILYGHASMDRIFGYGLKFGDNFHHTHLGWIGKLKNQGQ